jgi:hypothetical protein
VPVKADLAPANSHAALAHRFVYMCVFSISRAQGAHNIDKVSNLTRWFCITIRCRRAEKEDINLGKLEEVENEAKFHQISDGKFEVASREIRLRRAPPQY